MTGGTLRSVAAAGADPIVVALDRGRRAVFAYALRARPVARVLAQRDLRIAALSVLGAACALALTVAAPVVLFTLGPILLGVPHVASDVRYLVLRRAASSAWRAWAWAGCAALLALRVLEESHALDVSLAPVEALLATAWVMGAAVAGSAELAPGRSRRLRLAVAVSLAAALGLAAFRNATVARLVFVHAHNVVALAIWYLLFRRTKRLALLSLVTVAACTGWLLASQAPYGWTEMLHGGVAWRLHILTMSDWLAPGLPIRAALGLTYSYVFLQSIHYAVWLVWIPQEDTRAQGTLTFRMTVKGIVRDLRPLGVVAVAAALALVVGGAFVQIHRARALYLSVAMFHGYLELAALAYFLSRGGPADRRETREHHVGQLAAATA